MRTLFLLALVLTSCRSRPAAEIVLVVDTDMRPPIEIDAVRVTVNGLRLEDHAIDGPGALPATLTLIPSADEGARVHVVVEGLLAGAPIAREEVRTNFEPGPARELVVFLAGRCRLPDRPCTDTQLCTTSGCTALDRSGDQLPFFEGPHRVDASASVDAGPGDAGPGDAGGGDAGPRDAGLCIAGPEVCNGADDDCDGATDEPEDIAMLETDASNCGRCGNQCMTARCVNGRCAARRQAEAGLHTSCAVVDGSGRCRGLQSTALQVTSVLELQASGMLRCYRDLARNVSCQGGPFVATAWDPVENATGVSGLAVGSTHMCAIREGAAVCAGDQTRGQLGVTSATPDLAGRTVLSGGVTSVSAGFDFTCGVLRGRVFCWGANVCGQLGRSTTTEPGPVLPVQTAAGDLGDIVQVSCGGGPMPGGTCGGRPAHCCGVSSTGVAYCWGDNSLGQSQPSRIGGTALDARAVEGEMPPLRAVEVSSGVSCAIDIADDVWCWGDGRSGILGTTATGVLGPRRIFATTMGRIRELSLSVAEPLSLPSPRLAVNALALGWDGRIWCWGDRTADPCSDTGSPESVVEWIP